MGRRIRSQRLPVLSRVVRSGGRARRPRELNVSIIGAGSVGTTLAVLIRKSGHKVVSVVSKHRYSARRCANLVACKNYSTRLSDLHASTDFILLAVPDEAISVVAGRVARLRHLDFTHLHAAHTSGALSHEVLRPLHKKGTQTFSIHPIQTFSKNVDLRQQLCLMQDISYGFEGPSSARTFAAGLIRDLGGVFVEIPKEAKILYHLTCVFGSNFVVSLLGAAEELAQMHVRAPYLRHFEKLIRSSVDNALTAGPAHAITGPIVRGDARTVGLHMRRLTTGKAKLRNMYRVLGMYTLELVRKEKRLSPKKIRTIRTLLTR